LGGDLYDGCEAIGEPMWVRKSVCLVFFILLAACAQIRALSLPEGIKLLKGIDPSGLRAPIWSPDGKRIAAAYAIDSMSGLIAFFGPESRHDIVIIDTETWELSVLVSGDGGYIAAGTWWPDSKSFTMLWPGGPEGTGIYLFEVDSATPTYFSEWGILSPNLEKTAIFDEPYITVTDLHTKNLEEFKVPVSGRWDVYSWSPDMKQLTLSHQEHEKQGFTDIYLLELSSGKFSQFTNDKNYIKGSPIMSPDRQFLAYTMLRFVGNKIKEKLIISKLDQSCEWAIPIDDIGEFAWSPDSQRMFLIGDEGVYLADLNTIFGNDFSNGNDCP
jgi:Tol biopolymer transport system component